MTTISMAPEWALGFQKARTAATAATRAEAEPARLPAPSPEVKATADVAVRRLRPGAFQAYSPAEVDSEAAETSAERLRQTTWMRPSDSSRPGSALDVKA